MRKLSIVDMVSIVNQSILSDKELNKSVAQYFTSLHAHTLLVKKGRDAFRLAIEEFNLHGSEIVVPSWICSDVFVPILHHYNIAPRIVDLSKGKLFPSLADIKKSVTSKTKAIITVHTYGIPVPYIAELARWCKSQKIVLIEDCAHALNVSYKGKRLGSFGDAAIFSFVKEMPAFIGGLYVNNRRPIASRTKGLVQESELSWQDLKVGLQTLPFSHLLRRGSGGTHTSSQGSLAQIQNLPRIGKIIFTALNERVTDRRKKFVIENFLRDVPFKMPATKEELLAGSAKCIPFLVPNKKTVLGDLRKGGFNPGEGWIPSMTTNKTARSLWRLSRAPVAEYYEKNLVNIDTEEIVESDRYFDFLEALKINS